MNEELSASLNILAKAFAIFTIKDIEDRKQQIWLLQAMGFPNNDVAKILNTTKTAVAMTISRMKTDKSKVKGEEEIE